MIVYMRTEGAYIEIMNGNYINIIRSSGNQELFDSYFFGKWLKYDDDDEGMSVVDEWKSKIRLANRDDRISVLPYTADYLNNAIGMGKEWALESHRHIIEAQQNDTCALDDFLSQFKIIDKEEDAL